MQRFAFLAGSSSRCFRALAVNHFKNDRSLFEQGVTLWNTNNLILKRCLATKSGDAKKAEEFDPHVDLYKPSTAKERTHVPDDLKGHHQPPETINTSVKTGAVGGGKVWSIQNPDKVHVASYGAEQPQASVHATGENGPKVHQTTVHSTKGELNIADPFKTRTLQPEATPAQLAEAAAASAFEPFAPDTPLTATPVAEAVFAPKISSTDIYSTTSSPTAHFEATVPAPSPAEPVKYEVSNKPKVYGGQNTSADTKKHPKENPFELGQQSKPKQGQ